MKTDLRVIRIFSADLATAARSILDLIALAFVHEAAGEKQNYEAKLSAIEEALKDAADSIDRIQTELALGD